MNGSGSNAAPTPSLTQTEHPASSTQTSFRLVGHTDDARFVQVGLAIVRRQMHRRQFIALIGGSVALLPSVARSQQAAMPVIGFLGSETATSWDDRLKAFRQGLGDAGFVEGRNVAIEYRWAEGHNDRLPMLAADLVQRQITALVVLGGTASALAAKAAGTAVPVVFRMAVDSVEAGLVTSLNRPGGNVTGVTTMGAGLGPKQLELLHELVPAASMVALLSNPTNPSIARIQSRDTLQAARKLGLQLHTLNASEEHDFEPVFAKMKELRVTGLVIGADTFLNARSERLAALATRYAIPSVSPYKEFTQAGGLMSYGADISGASRQAGMYTGRILKGEKPADLPIQQPTLFEFVINLKSAKSLGLLVSPTLLARADNVIE
jgi:putative ABC transport system substrate-binding protein